MTAGTVTIAILIPITIGLGIAGYISPFVLGTGIINPAGGAINLLYTLLVPALYAFCGFLIGLGATLAIYVPLIPYIIFTFGAIGWLLSTVEAMVAGPLVALGIISPSKQHHELLGKAEPALMLIFNIFLRPSLMIFGLIAAILLSKVILTMIDTVFWSLVKDAIVGEAPGPLQYIVFLLAYVALVVAALNKCFAAIYIIPQQVMMWIGGQGAQYGEAEAAGEVRSKTEQAGQMVGGAAAGTEATAKTGATETHARTTERKKQQNAGPTLE
jgi:conjugal transfer/type IV secretion protein DotA/TraY